MKKNTQNIKSAKFSKKPPELILSTGKSGKKYERRVENAFSKAYGKTHSFMVSPWVEWVTHKGTVSQSEPDMLMFDHQAKKVWVIETKSWNWIEGINDLKYSYLGLVKCLYPTYEVRGVVCNPKKGSFLKNFDFYWDLEKEEEIKLVKISLPKN